MRIAQRLLLALSISAAALGAAAQGKTLPFTQEENKDGSRWAWFLTERTGFFYDYAVAQDLPASPAFRKLGSQEPRQTGDMACWPTFVALYGPGEPNEGDLMLPEGRGRLSDYQARLGSPTWLRRIEGWYEINKQKAHQDGSLPFWEQLLVFSNPNPSAWKEFKREARPDGLTIQLSFKRQAIRSMDGWDIQPFISVILERMDVQVPDAKTYFQKFKNHPFMNSSLKKVEDRDGAVIAHWTYESKGYSHQVRCEYFVRGKVGGVVSCDSTDSVFDHVDMEFQDWLKSFHFK